MNYTITWPDYTTEVVDAIRGAIGRDTYWYIVASSTPCPVCSLDPVTNTSTNSFCVICSGTYWIDVYSGVSISGHITWGTAEVLQWTSGGQYFTGDCRVQIKDTPSNRATVDNTKYAIVDTKKLRIDKVIYRGVKQLNRILIDLVEDEE